MKNYEVLLLDLDDTLVDDTENRQFAYKKMVEYFGFSYTEKDSLQWIAFDNNFWESTQNQIVVPNEYKRKEEYIKYIRSYRYYLFFQKKITLREALNYNDRYLKSLEEHVVPMPYAEEIISYLQKKYKLYIATESPLNAVKEKLTKINCYEKINGFFSRDMTLSKTSKPHPLFLQDLMKYIEYESKEKILIIGDNIKKDVALGNNTQVDSIWYNYNRKQNNTNYTPTYEIHSLLELKKVL